MAMFKYLMLFVVLAGLTVSCNKDRSAEAKAYAAGCSEGINTLLASVGAGANQEAIDKHCAETAAAYVKALK
jgi:hypothetical protein